MTHRSRLWKSPELTGQYELYRQNSGLFTSVYPDLYEEAGPRHIHDIVMEARAILKCQGSNAHVFSGATVGHVAQYDVAPDHSQRLDGASFTYDPSEDTYAFTRLYDTRISLRDILKRRELLGIAEEYGDEEAVEALAAQEAVSESQGQADFMRRTDVFFRDMYLRDESSIESIWADGVFHEHRTELFLGADYMAIGYLLEYNGLIERP